MVLILRDKLSERILEWYFGEKKSCPRLTEENSFLAKSAVELALMIKRQEISSTKLIQATIDRINEVNGNLNAIVDGPFVEEALKEAQVIDDRISNKLISEGMYSFGFIFTFLKN